MVDSQSKLYQGLAKEIKKLLKESGFPIVNYSLAVRVVISLITEELEDLMDFLWDDLSEANDFIDACDFEEGGDLCS